MRTLVLSQVFQLPSPHNLNFVSYIICFTFFRYVFLTISSVISIFPIFHPIFRSIPAMLTELPSMEGEQGQIMKNIRVKHKVCLKVFSSVQSLSHVQLFATSWTRQASLSITNSQSLLKLTFIESVMPSNHLILWRPLLLLTSIFPNIRVFSNESVLRIRWPKYWSFSFSITPSNEHLGLISFRMDWLDLLATQESSPTPQFRSINSFVLSFLYSLTLTSVHDY